MPSVTIKWGKYTPKHDRFINTVEFQTQAELDAYLQGIDDMDGWLDYEVIEDLFEPADLKDVPITP